MNTLVILLIVLVVLGGGGAYWGQANGQPWAPWGGGLIGVLVLLLILKLLGVF